MTTKAQRAEQAEAAERLREWIKPGDTVYTVLRHVSSSGMSRAISLIRTDHSEHGRPHDFSYVAARAMGDKIDQRWGGIKISGAGMDMGYALVYNLGRTLYPDGFDCIGEPPGGHGNLRGCPSNDHSNGDRNYSPDHRHSDGGYALRHDWL